MFLHRLEVPVTDAGRPDNIVIMKSESVAKTEVETTSPDQLQIPGEDQVPVKGRQDRVALYHMVI